jgi:hypothetical protein
MIWSGTTESLDDVSQGLVQKQVEGLILPELERLGIVPPVARK